MKRIIAISITLFALMTGVTYAQMGGGQMMGQTDKPEASEEHPCPMRPGAMGYGMGQGMMMEPGMGHRMGPGMMGGGMDCGMMGGGMGPGMMGGGRGYGMMEQGYSKEYKEFLDKTRSLRKELNAKKFDYFEALRDPDEKAETVSAIGQEVRELQMKIFKKRQKIMFNAQ